MGQEVHVPKGFKIVPEVEKVCVHTQTSPNLKQAIK